MILLQFAVLFLFLELGEGFVLLTGLPVPGCIVGMLMLAFSLQFKLIKMEWIADIADFLCANLGFFFIPAGVGVMQCFGIIKAEWMPIVVATVISTAIIIFVSGWTHSLTRKLYHNHYAKLHMHCDENLNCTPDDFQENSREISDGNSDKAEKGGEK